MARWSAVPAWNCGPFSKSSREAAPIPDRTVSHEVWQDTALRGPSPATNWHILVSSADAGRFRADPRLLRLLPRGTGRIRAPVAGGAAVGPVAAELDSAGGPAARPQPQKNNIPGGGLPRA